MNYKTITIKVDLPTEGLYDELLLEKKDWNNNKEVREWIEEEVKMGNFEVVKE